MVAAACGSCKCRKTLPFLLNERLSYVCQVANCVSSLANTLQQCNFWSGTKFFSTLNVPHRKAKENHHPFQKQHHKMSLLNTLSCWLHQSTCNLNQWVETTREEFPDGHQEKKILNVQDTFRSGKHGQRR